MRAKSKHGNLHHSDGNHCPAPPAMTPERARQRARLTRQIREFFAARGLLEVETPQLSAGAIADRHIDLYTVTAAPASTRYLQSSPEQHMKRLLCEGYPDIFQIARVFRAGEVGAKHTPEFTMLEWYRRDYSMMQLADEVAMLCTAVVGSRPVQKLSYGSVVREHTGIDPLATSREQLLEYLAARVAVPNGLDTLTDMLQYLFATVVEPRLDPDALVFVYHYPAEQAVLAKTDAADPRIALRFELFYGGLELANGWEELADAEQILARADLENRERVRLGKAPVPLHPRFVESLKHEGLPACSGVALGVERLLMCATGAAHITEVMNCGWEQA